MTYADDFNLRDKANATLNDIADAVDGLLISYGQDGAYGSQVIASTSYTDITDITESVTVADGEVVLVLFSCAVNEDTASDTIQVRLVRDATELGYHIVSTTDANDWVLVTLNIVDAPSAGTYTYKAQLKNATAARNINIGTRWFQVIKFQNT